MNNISEEMKNEIVEKLTTSTTYLEEMKRFANELKYAYR